MTLNTYCIMYSVLLLVAIVVLSVLGYMSYSYTRRWLHYPVEENEFDDLVIVCSSGRCAEIARKVIVESSGGLGDAAVAALACMSVLLPHKTGLGGGLMALYYNDTNRSVEALDALGKTPLDATEAWFAQNGKGRATAIIPGAASGYAYLHRRLGRMDWGKLFEPAINLAEHGFVVDKHLAAALVRNDNLLQQETRTRQLFWNRTTNKLVTEKEAMRNSLLSKLLTDISANDGRYFYNGRLAEEVVEDLKRGGSPVNYPDFGHYHARWSPAIRHGMNGDRTFHAPAIPGTGALLGLLVNDIALSQTVLVPKGGTPELPYMSGAELHRLVEALKFSFAKKADLGDTAESKENQTILISEIATDFRGTFNNQAPLANLPAYKARGLIDGDEGGVFLALHDRTGDALAIVSSLNSEFGSGYMTTSGIIMNNFMEAFSKTRGVAGGSLKGSEQNKLASLKSPITTMLPAIITRGQRRNAELHAVLGATGGLPAISALAQAELLRKYQHKVEDRTVSSTACGFVATGRGTWLAVADVNDTSGGVAGKRYRHPVLSA